MRKLVITLTFLCVVFAGTTLHFARELAAERARHAEAVAASAPAATAAPPAPGPAPRVVGQPDVVTDAAPTHAPEPAAPAHPPLPGEDEIKASQLRFAQTFLEQVADPRAREDLVAERRMQMRQGFPGLDRVVGLTGEELGRLLILIAEEQVNVQAEHSRCAVDPSCDPQRWSYSNAAHQQEITALLGADRAQKFETYKNTLGEREAITQMRARLPDSQRLSDANAEGLIAALAEERDLMSRRNSQHGGYFGFGTGSGMLYAPSEGTPESQYEGAREYSQRLRDRAASYLNSEQLRLFNEMQDEQLLAFRNVLRTKNGPYSAISYRTGSP